MDFGLTRNQAKVYVAVARLRLASVGKISKVAKVRREDVYRILPKLQKMGLVEKLLGTPTKIRATPVEEALSLLIKHKEDEAREKVSSCDRRAERLEGVVCSDSTHVGHSSSAPFPLPCNHL